MLMSRTALGADGRSLALLSLVLGGASLCSATTTYDVNLTIGGGTVTGNIVTDGATGALNDSSILDWNLVLNDGTHTFDLLGLLHSGGGNSNIYTFNSGLSATSTQLLFDFSGGDTFYFLWYTDSGLPSVSQAELCFGTTPDACQSGSGAGELIRLSGDYFSPGYNGDGSHNQFTSLTGSQVIGTSADSSAPEPSTLTLLGAGLLMIGARKAGHGQPQCRYLRNFRFKRFGS